MAIKKKKEEKIRETTGMAAIEVGGKSFVVPKKMAEQVGQLAPTPEQRIVEEKQKQAEFAKTEIIPGLISKVKEVPKPIEEEQPKGILPFVSKEIAKGFEEKPPKTKAEAALRATGNVLGDIQLAAGAGAGAWGVGAAIGAGAAIPTFATIAPKVAGNTKLARQIMRFVGVGSLAGITTKAGVGKRQAVTDANTLFSDAKTNIGSIISSLNSRAITPQEATELFNQEMGNLNLSESALKQLTKGSITSFLSGGKDEMTKLNDYKYGNGLLLDRKALELAINKYYGVVPR